MTTRAGRRAATVDGARGRSALTGPLFAKDDDLATAKAALPRILIVEDDYLVASEVEAGLTDAGFEIVGVAMSADEAVRMAKTERPALAIVDIRLRGKRDGVDAAVEMFRDHGIRSIFATAHADPDTRRRAQPAAPLAWLAKPYRTDGLVQLIRAALHAEDNRT